MTRLSQSQITEALALRACGFSNSVIAWNLCKTRAEQRDLEAVRDRRKRGDFVPLSWPDIDTLVAQLFDPPKTIRVYRGEGERAGRA